jgi:hypothetical protein
MQQKGCTNVRFDLQLSISAQVLYTLIILT